jgi:hypothetical protein
VIRAGSTARFAAHIAVAGTPQAAAGSVRRRWRARVLSQSAQHVEITAGLQHDEQKGTDMNAKPAAAIRITGRPSCQ